MEVVIKTNMLESTTNDNKTQVTRRQTIYTKPFLTCIPEKVVIHRSPIEHVVKRVGEKYTIHFIGAEKSGCRIIKHKTVSEIITELKESNNVMADFSTDVALSMILKEFERKELVEENTDMDLVGFFLDNKKNLIASNIDIIQPNKEDILDALNCLEQLTKYFEGRLDLLSSVIKWTMQAPLCFVLKMNGLSFLKWLVLWGITTASKSSLGLIMLAIDDHHNDSSFIKGQGSIDSIARLGDLISTTTFPKMVNEVDLTSDQMRYIVEHMKTAIDSIILRDKFTNSKNRSTTSIPELCPLFLTSNSSPPYYNSGFMRRIIDRCFPNAETHKSSDPIAKEFSEFLLNNLHRLKLLGQFRNWHVMTTMNNQSIQDKELGFNLIVKAYEYAGICMPEWFNLKLSENQLEESLSDGSVDVKSAFEAHITNSFDRFLPIWRIENPELKGVKLEKSTTDRLAKLLDSNRLPDIKRNMTNNIMIYKGILAELYRLGVTKDQLPNLRALSDYMSAEYTRDRHGYYVVKATVSCMKAYLD